jgi:hypothetical protein
MGRAFQRLARTDFSVVAQLLHPLFQNQLIVRLDVRKGDPHSTLRRSVRDPAESHEAGTAVGDPSSHLCSRQERLVGPHTASIQAQVTGSPLNLGF